MTHLSDYLTLPGKGAVAVVITTAAMYAVFVIILRLWGQRLFASPSALTLATASVLGAVVGRTSLGLTPTLEGGLLALATLLLLERAFGVVRRGGMGAAPAAEVLLVGGRVDADALRRHRLTEGDLWTSLRLKGVADPEEVSLVVLEPDGEVSVLRGPVSRAAVAGIRGAEALPASLFGEA